MCILRAPSLNSMLWLNIGEATPENVATFVRMAESERRLMAPQTASNAASDKKLMISRARSPRNDQDLGPGLLTATTSMGAEFQRRRPWPSPRLPPCFEVRIWRQPA